MKKYDYLLFDNDGTLMDFQAAQKTAFKKAYEECEELRAFPYKPEHLECYGRNNHRWWKKLEDGECNKAELQIGRFADFLNELGLTANPAEFNTRYMEELGNGTFLINGALEVIKRLSKEYKICIITNGVAETQYRRINKSELSPYIDGIFVSEDAGFAKPAAEYFDYVIEHAKIEHRSKCIVIGDSLSSDILGANNSEIDSIWYNPTGENQSGLRINYEIASLEELYKIL